MKLDPAKLAQAFQQGELAQLARLRSGLGRITAGPSARCAEWIALACAGLGRTAEAASLFAELAEVEPDRSSHCANLASSLLAGGQAWEALNVLKIGLIKWPKDTTILVNYGICAFATAHFALAAKALHDALARNPADDLARLYAVRAYQESGQSEEAAGLLAEWQPQWQSFAVAELYQYAKIWIVENSFDQAEEALIFLRRMFPEESTATINLAAMYERANRLEQSATMLAAVPQSATQLPLYRLLKGKLCAREGDLQMALEQFDRARAASAEHLDGLIAERYFSELEFERGRVLDRLGRYEDAFAAFSRANILIRDLHRRYHPAIGDGTRIEWLVDDAALDQVIRRQSVEPRPEAPVFIVGFPRSGTTLLDQMLDAHPALQVLEEKPALEAVVTALSKLPGGYPAALLDCDANAIEGLRQVYWKTVAKHIELQPGKRLVDKYPFNLARIQLAMTLFPTAQWIFAIRHPCDVVLSCFMQNFRFTDSTHGFWNLQQTASIYRQFIELWLQQRSRLQPDCLDLQYEDLVGDFEAHARRLIDFLGLEWDPGVLAYHEHARTRRIGTPSYHQVIKPIYGSARGRWLHYRQWFGDAEKTLEPLARRLGYASFDSAAETRPAE